MEYQVSFGREAIKDESGFYPIQQLVVSEDHITLRGQRAGSRAKNIQFLSQLLLLLLVFIWYRLLFSLMGPIAFGLLISGLFVLFAIWVALCWPRVATVEYPRSTIRDVQRSGRTVIFTILPMSADKPFRVVLTCPKQENAEKLAGLLTASATSDAVQFDFTPLSAQTTLHTWWADQDKVDIGLENVIIQRKLKRTYVWLLTGEGVLFLWVAGLLLYFDLYVSHYTSPSTMKISLILVVIALINFALMAYYQTRRKSYRRAEMTDIQQEGREIRFTAHNQLVTIHARNEEDAYFLNRALHDQNPAGEYIVFAGPDKQRDELGFIGKGRFVIHDATLIISGRVNPQGNLLTYLLAFIAVDFADKLLKGVLIRVAYHDEINLSITRLILLPLFILFALRYPRTRKFPRHAIQGVEQAGREVTFLVPDSQRSFRRSVIFLQSEDDARSLAAMLSSTVPAG